MVDCEHNYQFQGVVYSHKHQLPGSSAYERIYEDRYYCTKCLDVKDVHSRVQGNSYQHPIQGSFPK